MDLALSRPDLPGMKPRSSMLLKNDRNLLFWKQAMEQAKPLKTLKKQLNLVPVWPSIRKEGRPHKEADKQETSGFFLTERKGRKSFPSAWPVFLPPVRYAVFLDGPADFISRFL